MYLTYVIAKDKNINNSSEVRKPFGFLTTEYFSDDFTFLRALVLHMYVPTYLTNC